jgi:hypothetical protein
MIGNSGQCLLGGDRIVKNLDDAIKVGNQSFGLGRFPGSCRLKMTLMFHCACFKWSDLAHERVNRASHGSLRKKPAKANGLAKTPNGQTVAFRSENKQRSSG